MLQGEANFHRHLPLLHALCFPQVGTPSVSREQMAARLPKQHPQDTRTHTRLFILEDGLLTNSISERGWHFTSYAQKTAPQVSRSFRERLKCAGKGGGDFIDLESPQSNVRGRSYPTKNFKDLQGQRASKLHNKSHLRQMPCLAKLSSQSTSK